MKLRDSKKTIKVMLTLIREIRPDQAQNFANADKFFETKFVEQFGDIEADLVMDSIERGLAYDEGPVIVATIFNWVRKGIQRDQLRKTKEAKTPQQGYYD